MSSSPISASASASGSGSGSPTANGLRRVRASAATEPAGPLSPVHSTVRPVLSADEDSDGDAKALAPTTVSKSTHWWLTHQESLFVDNPDGYSSNDDSYEAVQAWMKQQVSMHQKERAAFRRKELKRKAAEAPATASASVSKHQKKNDGSSAPARTDTRALRESVLTYCCKCVDCVASVVKFENATYVSMGEPHVMHLFDCAFIAAATLGHVSCMVRLEDLWSSGVCDDRSKTLARISDVAMADPAVRGIVQKLLGLPQAPSAAAGAPRETSDVICHMACATCHAKQAHPHSVRYHDNGTADLASLLCPDCAVKMGRSFIKTEPATAAAPASPSSDAGDSIHSPSSSSP